MKIVLKPFLGYLKRLVLVAALVAVPLIVCGQDAGIPDRLSLEEATQLFIRHNPNLIQSLAAASRQSEVAQTSALWPNPSVDLEQERAGTDKQQTALIDQPILNPVEYRSRKQSANVQGEAFFATYREEAASLYFELRKKYVTAISMQSKLEVVSRLTNTVRRAIEISQVRSEEGVTRSFELNRLKTALADFENRMAQHKVERNEAYSDLISYIAPQSEISDINKISNIELTDSLRYQPFEYSISQLMQTAYQQRGIINAANFSTEASRQQLRAEKAARFPDLSVRGGFVRETALASPTAPFLGIGIGIPIWNNNGHQIKASRAELKQSQAQLNIARRKVQLEVHNAYDQFQSYKDRVERINRELLKRKDSLVEDALYLYSEGSISLVELLDAVSASQDAQLLKLELLTQYNISRYQIDRVVGQIPESINPSN